MFSKFNYQYCFRKTIYLFKRSILKIDDRITKRVTIPKKAQDTEYSFLHHIIEKLFSLAFLTIEINKKK